MRDSRRKQRSGGKNVGLIFGAALLGVLAYTTAAQAEDKVLFIPEAVLLDFKATAGNSDKFHYDYGPATCTPTDVAGPGVRFDCTGVTDSGTGYGTGYPINSLIGCTGTGNANCTDYQDGDGNNKYRMKFTNLTDDCALRVKLYMVTTWSGGQFWVSGLSWINAANWGDNEAVMELDLDNAECWSWNGTCPYGDPYGGGSGAVTNIDQTVKLGIEIIKYGGCTDPSFIVSAFDQETSLTAGNNTTITCPGHSLQGYTPSGTLYYNDFDQGFRGYADLSGLLPNHKYLLSFEGLASEVALTSDELAGCGIAVNDGGRLTTPGGTWPASGGGEFEGTQVVFVDFEEIETDASGDYSGSFYFDCNGLISDGDLFETRFIVKDEHSWSIHDCTGTWKNEALYADNVDFDPPFDEDSDGHTTASELTAGSDPDDQTSIPLQEARLDGEGRGRAKDQLMTFASLSERGVTPVLSSRYTMIINWGPTVDPETFSARIGREDVTALFLPVIPGTSRVLTLPLDATSMRPARLVLRIKGEVTSRGGRVRLKRDRDWLRFLVP